MGCAEQVSFPSRVYARTTPEIHLLPPVYNWEFTRRHPYYLQYQPLAAFYFTYTGSELQAFWRSDLWDKADKAAAIIRRLGWVGPYMDSSHDARKLPFLRHKQPPFSNPNAHPASYDYLAARLLLDLPKETRRQVGRILAGEGWETEGPPIIDELATGLAALQRIPDPIVSHHLADLLVISPEASEKGVMDAVRQMLPHLKSQPENAGKRRLSEAQLDEYLQVWDLREGWVNGRYDWSCTKRYREIALEINTPEGTVKNRYRAAFRYITGQDYTPELFTALFGPLACHQSKWAGWRRSRQPRAETGSPKMVTNNAGERAREGRDSGILDQQPAGSYDPKDLIDLKTDILELTRRGRSVEQVAAELQIPAEFVPELIDFFEDHASEDF